MNKDEAIKALQESEGFVLFAFNHSAHGMPGWAINSDILIYEASVRNDDNGSYLLNAKYDPNHQNLPSYSLTGDKYTLKDLIVYIAETTCECTRDDLQKLIGTEIHGKKIVGVESNCIIDQSFKKIGLAVNK